MYDAKANMWSLPFLLASLLCAGTSGPTRTIEDLSDLRQGASAVPLHIVSIHRLPESWQIEFTLQNVGEKTITAWNVSFTVGTGKEAVTGGYGTDAYRAFAAGDPGSKYILPGRTITAVVAMPSRADPSAAVTVTPTSAVFADKSAVGDPKNVEFVFQRRAERRDAFLAMIDELKTALENGPTVESLEKLLGRLDQSLAKKPGDPVRAIVVRPSLLMAIKEVAEGRSASEAGLDSLLARMQQDLAAAIAHSR